MSVVTDEVTWENHQAWFNNSLQNRDRYLYVCALEDESRVGMCRFDVDAMSNTAEVSINLNPVYRGKKYSQRVLNMASKLFQDEVVAEMVATIKHENIASIKCFLGCNYICTHEDASYKYYRSH
jgi:L-amino acid N-acyltransferase YncA